ncbi:MAG: hypothetical protein KatS3mg126_1762 [Lysobacteraceae bacterium]|nr:MAG: hypothetical protein KatS3mg126_1762 [Xanthomonadaceae bacterium]
MNELERSALDSIGRSLWNLDLALLRLQLEGIYQLPDVEAVSIQERRSDHGYPALALSYGRPREDAPLVWKRRPPNFE